MKKFEGWEPDREKLEPGEMGLLRAAREEGQENCAKGWRGMSGTRTNPDSLQVFSTSQLLGHSLRMIPLLGKCGLCLTWGPAGIFGSPAVEAQPGVKLGESRWRGMGRLGESPSNAQSHRWFHELALHRNRRGMVHRRPRDVLMDS